MNTFVNVRRLPALIVLILASFLANAQSQQDLLIQFISTSVDFPLLDAQEVRRSNQLMVNLTTINPTTDAVYALRLSISGPGIEIYSKPENLNALRINSLGQKTLFASDLAAYFDVDNLNFTGISPDYYLENGLPEGSYTICVDVIDIAFDRMRPASNKSCKTLFVRKLRPPEILTPYDEEEIEIANNFVFSWTPQHIASQFMPYEVLFFERVEGVTEQELLLYYRPVLKELVYGQQFVYDRNRNRLEDGKKYVFYVRASPKFKNISFLNDGYSEGVEFQASLKSLRTDSELTKRSSSSFSISCKHHYYNGDHSIEVKVFDQEPETSFTVELNGQVVRSYETNDPFLLHNIEVGSHTIEVTDNISAAADDCVLEIAPGCYSSHLYEIPNGLYPLASVNLYYDHASSVAGQEVIAIEFVDYPQFFRNSEYCCNTYIPDGCTPDPMAKQELAEDLVDWLDAVFPETQHFYLNPAPETFYIYSNHGAGRTESELQFAFPSGEPIKSRSYFAHVSPGDPCDDGDPCTINDVLDADCNCAGEPALELNIEITEVNAINCNYELVICPQFYDLSYDFFDLLRLGYRNPWDFGLNGGHSLNSFSSPYATEFNFPYRIDFEFPNLGITEFVTDFNDWITLKGFQGSVELVNSQDCDLWSLKFNNLNFELLNVNFAANGDNFTSEFINLSVISCEELPQIIGYQMDAGHGSLDYGCFESTTYWEPGPWKETCDHRGVIFVEDVSYCYVATLPCHASYQSIPCIYQAAASVTGDCLCIPGTPCDLAAGMDPCFYYELDQNCDCVPSDLVAADSDGDGVCDEDDICPGHDDNIDSDGDTVPDGCDLCDCVDDLQDLTPQQIAALSDNDPSNDPHCGNGNFLTILGSDVDFSNATIQPSGDVLDFSNHNCAGQTCDFCLSVDVDETYYNPSSYFSSISYIDGSGNHNLNLSNEWVVLEDFDFEQTMSNSLWNVFGNNRSKRHNDASRAASPTFSVLLKTNSWQARMWSDILDMRSATKLKLDFTFMTSGYSNGNHKFSLQVSYDGGASFQNSDLDISEWIWSYGANQQNNVHYTKSVEIAGPFTENMVLRFVSNASGGNRIVFIDDVKVSTFESFPVTNLDYLAHFINSNFPSSAHAGEASHGTQSPICGLCPCDDLVTTEVLDQTQIDCDYCLPLASAANLDPAELYYYESLTYLDNNAQAQKIPLASWTEVLTESFESGLAGWTINPVSGTKHAHHGNFINYASDGTKAIRLKKNGQNATLEPPAFLSDRACRIKLEFGFKSFHFANNDKFFIEESFDGINFENLLVQTWKVGDHFENEIFYRETVYINGPFTTDYRMRFRCGANNGLDKLYIDDITISVFDCNVASDVDGLIQNVETLLATENVDLVHLENQLENSVCGEGDFIYVENSEIGLQNLNILGFNGALSLNFNSIDCGVQIPGQELYTLSASIDCDNPAYYWSTGATTSSIQVPSNTAGYIVDIVCPDGCSYTEIFGDENCIVGQACSTGDACAPNGVIDIDCNCVPTAAGNPDSDGDGIPDICDDCDGDNTADLDGTGIPDCYDCDCGESETTHTITLESPGTVCHTCLTLEDDDENIQLTGVQIGSYTLQSSAYDDFFDFPYCGTFDLTNYCSSPTMRDFKRDLIEWGMAQGWKIQVISDDALCSGLRVKNLPSSMNTTVTYSTTTNSYATVPATDCEDSNDPDYGAIYSLTINPPTCADCPTGFSYSWSDPSINREFVQPYLPQGTGYAVTLTCNIGNGCMVLYEVLGNCQEGEPCFPAGHCADASNAGTYDENCNCITPNPPDETDDDGDGVPNACDVCPGADDFLDDDNDGVPNCLEDECLNRIQSYTKMYEIPADKMIDGFTLPLNSPITVDFSTNSFFTSDAYCTNADPFDQKCDPFTTGIHELGSQMTAYLDNEFAGVDHFFMRHQGVWYIHVDQMIEAIIWNISDGSTVALDATSFDAPSQCDDNNPCSVNDHIDENCRCIGEALDSDADCIPDGCDQCPGLHDGLDINANGIPDCAEQEAADGAIPFACANGAVGVFDYYINLLQQTYKDDQGNTDFTVIYRTIDEVTYPTRCLQSVDTKPKMLQQNLLEVIDGMRQNLASQGWEPLCFGFPELIDQLENNPNDLPDYLNPHGPGNNEPFFDHNDLIAWRDAGAEPIQMALLGQLTIDVVNFVEKYNVEIPCSDGVHGEFDISPGCAEELGILVDEDDNCVLRDNNGMGCPILFDVDCDGECSKSSILLSFDEDCPPPEYGEECMLTPSGCYDANQAAYPCGVWEVVANPDYKPGNGQDPCFCVLRSLPNDENNPNNLDLIHSGDADLDGTCDDDDQCFGTVDNDNLDPPLTDENGDPYPVWDNDGDGINDCLDDCDALPGNVGDPCDDGNPATFNDAIQVIDGICNCIGTFTDVDGDGVPESPDCDGTVDYDGDGLPDAIVDEITYEYDPVTGEIIGIVEGAGGDGIPDCDVCPGLDDTEMNSPDDPIGSLPKCLNPPHTNLGCPENFLVVEGEGVVLVFDADGFDYQEIPQPISIMIRTNTAVGSETAFQYDFLINETYRENEGKMEVYYGVNNLNPGITNDILDFVAVSYGGHQQCAIEDFEPEYVHLGCPDEIAYYPTSEDLVLSFFPFGNTAFDPAVLAGGDITFDLQSSISTKLEESRTYMTNEVVMHPDGHVTIELEYPISVGLGDMATYSGTILMEYSGSNCTYFSGELDVACEDIYGNLFSLGEPCDDDDDCTENDTWTDVDGVCECKGTLIDADADGLCDITSENFVHLMCPTSMTSTAGNEVLTFDLGEDMSIDPLWLSGSIEFAPTVGDPQSLSYSIADINFLDATNQVEITLVDADNLISADNFNGVVTLPTGIACTFSSGSLSVDCTYNDGTADIDVTIGAPCDDGDDCTHHDRWYDPDGDGTCDCIGEDTPDSDGDGICDPLDRCEGLSDYDGDFDGVPDACECVSPVIESVEVLGYDKVKVVITQDGRNEVLVYSIILGFDPDEVHETKNKEYVFSNLYPGATYTIEVRYECSEAVTQEITIPETDGNPLYCGAELDVDLTNVIPLTTLSPGDVIRAADFKVVVDNATGQGGRFSGNGHIEIPFFNLAEVKASFYGIQVSNDHHLVDGEIVITGFGTSFLPPEFLDYLSDLVDGLSTISDYLGELISALDKIKNIVESFENHIDFQNSEDILLNYQTMLNGNPFVSDAVKNQFQAAIICLQGLDEDSTPAEVEACKLQFGLAVQALEAELAVLYDASGQAIFFASPNQEYGYDVKETNDIAGYPPEITVAGADYPIDWKSVEIGGAQDEVLRVDLSAVTDNVIFMDNNGEVTNSSTHYTSSPVTNSPGIYEITIPTSRFPQKVDEIIELYAVEQLSGGGIKLAGKINIIGYQTKNIDVEVIPIEMADMSNFDAGTVKTRLNEIFEQTIVSASSVTFVTPAYTGSAYNGDLGTPPTENNAYTDEMKDIISTYKAASNDPIGGTMYFFMVQNDATGIISYIPFNKGYGFLNEINIADDAALARAIAQQIGRGAFGLGDFPDDYTRRTPDDNLMSDSGTKLVKTQWDQVHQAKLTRDFYDENSRSQIEEYQFPEDRIKEALYKNVLEGHAVCIRCMDGQNANGSSPDVFSLYLEEQFYWCAIIEKTSAGLMYNPDHQSSNIPQFAPSDAGEYSAIISSFEEIPSSNGSIPDQFIVSLIAGAEYKQFGFCNSNSDYGAQDCQIGDVSQFINALTNDLSVCPIGNPYDAIETALDNLMLTNSTGAPTDVTYGGPSDIPTKLTDFVSYASDIDFNGTMAFFDRSTKKFYVADKSGVNSTDDLIIQQRLILDLADGKMIDKSFNQDDPIDPIFNAPDATLIVDFNDGSLVIKSEVNANNIVLNSKITGGSSQELADGIESIFQEKLEELKDSQNGFNSDFFGASPTLETSLNAKDGRFETKTTSYVEFFGFAVSHIKYIGEHLELNPTLWNPDNPQYIPQSVHFYGVVASIFDASLLEIKDIKELLGLIGPLCKSPWATIKGLVGGILNMTAREIVLMTLGLDDVDKVDPDTYEGRYWAARVAYKPILNIAKVIVSGGGALGKVLSTGGNSTSPPNRGLNLTENIRKTLKEINSEVFAEAFRDMSAEFQKLFVDDFIDKIDGVKSFFENLPEAIDYWKDVLNFNKKFRKNTDYLENCDDFIKRSPDNTIPELKSDIHDFPDDPKIGLDELGDSDAIPSNSGVWDQGPFRRGNDIETALEPFIPGNQTIPNFPTIDYWDHVTKTATSVKSTDLFAKTYRLDPEALELLWKSYVDKLVDRPNNSVFPITHGGVMIGGVSDPVLNRKLVLAIPGVPLPSQSGIRSLIEDYGLHKGIEVTFEIIE